MITKKHPVFISVKNSYASFMIPVLFLSIINSKKCENCHSVNVIESGVKLQTKHRKSSKLTWDSLQKTSYTLQGFALMQAFCFKIFNDTWAEVLILWLDVANKVWDLRTAASKIGYFQTTAIKTLNFQVLWTKSMMQNWTATAQPKKSLRFSSRPSLSHISMFWLD